MIKSGPKNSLDRKIRPPNRITKLASKNLLGPQSLHKQNFEIVTKGARKPPKPAPKMRGASSPCELSDIPPVHSSLHSPHSSSATALSCLPPPHRGRYLHRQKPRSPPPRRWLDQSEIRSWLARPITEQPALGDIVCPLSITLPGHLHFIPS